MIRLGAVRQRIAGILLFLPVPVVLVLFTRQPFGPGVSLLLGVALMASHRLYARPFALSRAGLRCLWCGGSAGSGPSLELREPPGTTAWRACSEAHRLLTTRTLGWAARRRSFVAGGVLGSLLVFLAAALAVAVRRSGALVMADAVALFRLGVAVTVLPLGWLAPDRGPGELPDGPLPFPVHIQALLGTLWVVWLFRLVGLWWLGAAVLYASQRLG